MRLQSIKSINIVLSFKSKNDVIYIYNNKLYNIIVPTTDFYFFYYYYSVWLLFYVKYYNIII